jgi:spermidine synthase
MNARSSRYTLLPWVLFLIGFTAIVAQIVLMRELIVVFHGNEISLGLILAGWLFWSAVGSGFLGRLTARAPRQTVAGLQAAVAVVFPLTILAVRTRGFAAGATPGEIMGPGLMFLTSFLSLSVFCAFSGWLFAAGSRLYAAEWGKHTDEATSSVYFLEAVGAGLGGILASIVLIRRLSSVEIVAVISLLNLIAAALLAFRSPGRRVAAAAVLAALFGGVVLPFGIRALDTFSLGYLWRGFDLVESRDSIYGNLAVVTTGETKSVFGNGVVQFTVPDPAAAEEAVHFALLQHAAPKSMLLVGGGVGGALAEALEHSTLDRVDYVELDPTVLELGREYFAESWFPVQANTRVDIHHVDGRLFMQSTDRLYDAIVIDLPDPQTAQLNRFYTLEFFRAAARRLEPDGVLSFQVAGAENYVSEELTAFLRCVYRTLRQVFPRIVVIPGATVHFFAGGDTSEITADPGVLVERLRARGVVTQYVREYFFPFRMTPDRMDDMRSRLEAEVRTPLNSDFAPAAYYFDVVLWSTRFHQAYRGVFQTLGNVDFGAVAGAVALALAILVALVSRRARGERRLGIGAGACVATMGCTQIGVQVLLLLAFQAVYGYVYHQLALMIALFMVGMALGSWMAIRRSTGDTSAGADAGDARLLLGLQLAAVGLPLALYALIAATSRVTNPAGVVGVSNVMYPVLALGSGWLGGFQFPIASRFFFGRAVTSSSPGSVYAIDLAGACVGAVVFSAYLIPVFGFFKTAVLMALVNAAPAVVVARAQTDARRESSA